MSTYNYDYVTDFGSSLDQLQLQNEVVADVGISPTILRVDRDGDTIKVVFNSALSAGEQTTLDGIVSAHVPTIPLGSNVMSIPTTIDEVEDTSYITVSTLNYHSGVITTMTHIKVVSDMDEGGTSYDLRLIDLSNNNVICSANLTNLDEQSNDLGTLSNLPSSDTVLELQCKVNGSSVANLSNVSLFYN